MTLLLRFFFSVPLLDIYTWNFLSILKFVNNKYTKNFFFFVTFPSACRGRQSLAIKKNVVHEGQIFRIEKFIQTPKNEVYRYELLLTFTGITFWKNAADNIRAYFCGVQEDRYVPQKLKLEEIIIFHSGFAKILYQIQSISSIFI